MLYIDESWIKPLTYGSAFLGSGGGGKTELMAEQLQAAIEGKRIALLGLDEIDPQESYFGVAQIGSPEINAEYIPSGWEGKKVMDQLSEICQLQPSGINAVEGAGVNTIYPILVAARTGLPLIDADAMGRAFPELQMTTYHLYGLKATPFVLVDSFNQIISFKDEDTFLLEINTRQVIGSRGGIGYFAAFPCNGATLGRVLLPETISFTRFVGEAFCQASNYLQLLKTVSDRTRNSYYGSVVELFLGRVEQISEIEGTKWRKIMMTSGQDSFEVLLQYENLIAFKNHTLAAIVPDLIILIDLESLLPVNNNEVKKGEELAVWGLPAPLPWRINAGLNLVGPHCFGYRSRYIPIERLYQSVYFPEEVL